MKASIVLTALVALVSFAGATQARTPRIAIIIDDLGYTQAAGRRAIALPGPVACAILPDSPRGRTLAREANVRGKEVLLHLPMQAANYDGATEAGSLTLDMSRQAMVASIDAALSEIPEAIGINNHQGSLLTRHPGHMQWLMQEIRTRSPLFFIDSYTTADSIAMMIAGEEGVPAAKRDVFLDSDPSPDRVRSEFERLKTLARRQGFAIGIGHPYEVTLSLLEELLPGLSAEGIELVPVSELLKN